MAPGPARSPTPQCPRPLGRPRPPRPLTWAGSRSSPSSACHSSTTPGMGSMAAGAQREKARMGRGGRHAWPGGHRGAGRKGSGAGGRAEPPPGSLCVPGLPPRQPPQGRRRLRSGARSAGTPAPPRLAPPLPSSPCPCASPGRKQGRRTWKTPSRRLMAAAARQEPPWCGKRSPAMPSPPRRAAAGAGPGGGGSQGSERRDPPPPAPRMRRPAHGPSRSAHGPARPEPPQPRAL